MLPIAVDVMSGDRGPGACVPGALLALGEAPGLELLLVGDPAVVEPLLADAGSVRSRAAVVPASQVVAMGERPRDAVCRKKDSSMRRAVDLVREGRASACVSAGNTGALVAIAHFVLKTAGAVERAAILSAIPSAHGHTYMLDLGANVGATAAQLAQFAAMGATVAREVYGIAAPRVGLLNVGEEDIKGHDVVQAAHALIGASGLRYVGFVEGDDIFSGEADVVVTDGFTGNVALKTMEGAARLIALRLREEFGRTPGSRLAALAARPVLRRVADSVDPRRYNGACMVGLNGVVVKSHGSADPVAFSRAVALAGLAARRGLARSIARALEEQRS